MEEMVKTVKKFIKDNNLDFSGEGSELNGNCVILAGFICYVVDENNESVATGRDIIKDLTLGAEPSLISELNRVYDFAFYSGYEDFWKTEDAKETYVF